MCVARLRDMPSGAPRLAGFDYVGVFCYSLTICTHQRRTIFVDRGVVDPVLQQILRTAGEHAFEVFAYCFMPDHLHLLAGGLTDHANLSRFVKSWKQKTGYDYARQHHARLWQVGFFDHILCSDESVLKHARYILGNPVRAGLVRNVDEYPYAALLIGDGDAESLWP
jgi:putative transposase